MSSTKKTRWLDRRIAHPGPYLCLCTTEAEYMAAARHLKVTHPLRGMNPGSQATMHTFVKPDGQPACLVCIDVDDTRTPVEVAGLLVHEAVHVWQEYCLGIGEKNPGAEQEAYGIQAIAQELMAAYAAK